MMPESWARFCGFLASRQATIYAVVRSEQLTSFSEAYYNATGEDLPPEGEGCGYAVCYEGQNKWANSMHVTVRASDGELMDARAWSALPLEVEVKRDGDTAKIHNASLALSLLSYGFRLGPEQDADEIQAHFPLHLWPEFDEGVRVGESK